MKPLHSPETFTTQSFSSVPLKMALHVSWMAIATGTIVTGEPVAVVGWWTWEVAKGETAGGEVFLSRLTPRGAGTGGISSLLAGAVLSVWPRAGLVEPLERMGWRGEGSCGGGGEPLFFIMVEEVPVERLLTGMGGAGMEPMAVSSELVVTRTEPALGRRGAGMDVSAGVSVGMAAEGEVRLQGGREAM